MDNDICAVLEGADQIGSTKSIINNNRKSIAMSDFCNGVDIRDVTVGIAESLQINGSGVLPDRRFHFLQIMSIYETGLDSVLGKCVSEQVKAASVNGLLRYNMAAICSKCLDCIGDGCRSGCQCQGCASAL